MGSRSENKVLQSFGVPHGTLYLPEKGSLQLNAGHRRHHRIYMHFIMVQSNPVRDILLYNGAPNDRILTWRRGSFDQ